MIRFNDLSYQQKIFFFPGLEHPYEDPDRQLKAVNDAEKKFDRMVLLVEELTDVCNNFDYSVNPAVFAFCLSHEHRTLQQSVTRFLLKWVEYAASDEYGKNTDLRNQATHDLCKFIVAAVIEKNNIGPSASLPTI